MWKNIAHVWNGSLKCSFGKTWWKLFKKRNKQFVSHLAQNMESQRAAAKVSAQQWGEFFNSYEPKQCIGGCKVFFNAALLLVENTKNPNVGLLAVGCGLWAVCLLAKANTNRSQTNVQRNDVIEKNFCKFF